MPIRKAKVGTTQGTIFCMSELMEKVTSETLTYYLESKGHISSYQRELGKGMKTMKTTLCLEHEIRRAQLNKCCSSSSF